MTLAPLMQESVERKCCGSTANLSPAAASPPTKRRDTLLRLVLEPQWALLAAPEMELEAQR
jgi:hypothetical protein